MTEELSATNRITILTATNAPYTHTAHHIRLGIWQATFSCGYLVQHGILRNAKVIFINPELQMAVGEERELTEKEVAEDARMDAEYGLSKVRRSESISLSTFKAKEDRGSHFLKILMYIVREEVEMDVDVTAVAKKVVEGQRIGLSVAEKESLRSFVRYDENEEEGEEHDSDDDHVDDEEKDKRFKYS